MTIPEKFAMTGSRSSIHRDHNGDLIKLDESISPPGSIETTSPGETELALPEEQKLVKRKGGRKPVSWFTGHKTGSNLYPIARHHLIITPLRSMQRQRNGNNAIGKRKQPFESAVTNI